jgi:hypothetical protein
LHCVSFVICTPVSIKNLKKREERRKKGSKKRRKKKRKIQKKKRRKEVERGCVVVCLLKF